MSVGGKRKAVEARIPRKGSLLLGKEKRFKSKGREGKNREEKREGESCSK